MTVSVYDMRDKADPRFISAHESWKKAMDRLSKEGYSDFAPVMQVGPYKTIVEARLRKVIDVTEPIDVFFGRRTGLFVATLRTSERPDRRFDPREGG